MIARSLSAKCITQPVGQVEPYPKHSKPLMLRSLKTLESCIAEIEKHYDDLNLAKAQCDASDPAPEFHGSS